MITLLTGENSFELERELGRLVVAFDGAAERIDGSEIELWQLPDLLMGATLFAEKRLVIMKNLSENKQVWPHFGEWVAKVSDDIHLVLIEPKLDKRTSAYKALQKHAQTKVFAPWTGKDRPTAEKWAVQEAKDKGLALPGDAARYLVQRVGEDQWRLYHAIEKLALLGEASREHIDSVTDLHPEENVFALLEMALAGDAAKVQAMTSTLAQTEDPYRVFGLLASQIMQLAALALSDDSPAELAKQIKANPYVLSKLARPAAKLSSGQAKAIVQVAAETDRQMKSLGVEPWVLVEQLLLKIALR